MLQGIHIAFIIIINIGFQSDTL